LRYEIRLGKRAKIKDILQKVNSRAEMIFEDLFNQEIAQKILMYFWDKTTSDMLLFSFDESKPQDMYSSLKQNNKLTNDKALKHLSILTIINSVGIEALELYWKVIARIGLGKGLKESCLH